MHSNKLKEKENKKPDVSRENCEKFYKMNEEQQSPFELAAGDYEKTNDVHSSYY